MEVSSRDRAEIPVMLITICVLIDYPEIGPSPVYMFHPCIIDSNISPSSRQVHPILAAYKSDPGSWQLDVAVSSTLGKMQ